MLGLPKAMEAGERMTEGEHADAPASTLVKVRISETRYTRTFSADDLIALMKASIRQEACVDRWKPYTVSVQDGHLPESLTIQLVVQEPAY